MKRNTRAMVQNSVAATGTFFEMDIYNNPMPYFEGLGILILAVRSRMQEYLKRVQQLLASA